MINPKKKTLYPKKKNKKNKSIIFFHFQKEKNDLLNSFCSINDDVPLSQGFLDHNYIAPNSPRDEMDDFLDNLDPDGSDLESYENDQGNQSFRNEEDRDQSDDDNHQSSWGYRNCS